MHEKTYSDAAVHGRCHGWRAGLLADNAPSGIDTFVIMGGLMALAGIVALALLPRNNLHVPPTESAAH